MIMKSFLFVLVLVFAAASLGFAREPVEDEVHDAIAVIAASAEAKTTHWKYISAALAVGLSCIAGGIAVGRIGAAAMGAMSENPELSAKALPFAGLAEGICLWGFLVALLILVL